MKKMLVAAALCAGILAFANTELAEAADQQSEKVTTITQVTDADSQQLSTAYDDNKRRRR